MTPVDLHFVTQGFTQMDFRAMASVTCPTLVMAGDNDPITPIAFSETIVASLPPGLAQFERFADCGHGIVRDADTPFRDAAPLPSVVGGKVPLLFQPDSIYCV